MDNHITSILSNCDCERIFQEYKKNSSPYIALWGSSEQRQSVEVMLYFRGFLERKGFHVILFLRSLSEELLYIYKDSYDMKGIYFLDDPSLFVYMDFFNIIFLYDFVTDLEILRKVFKGKIVLFPHNARRVYPENGYPDYIADYIVSSCQINIDTIQYDYLYKFFPNYYFNQSLTIIYGNPKFDLLKHKISMLPSLDRCYIVYYPCSLYVSLRNVPDELWLIDQIVFLIKTFLIRYKHFYFVLRPYSIDRDDKFFSKIYDCMKNEERFIIDKSDDNYYYLTRATYFITDMSSVDVNFAMSKLVPVIYLNYKNNADNIKEDTLGYRVHSVAQTLEVIDLINASKTYWHNKLLNFREVKYPFYGNTCSELSCHINDIINDNKVSTWITFLQNTLDVNKISTWLILIAHWIKRGVALNAPYFINWSKKVNIVDSRIGLLAIKYYIHHMPKTYNKNFITVFRQIQEAIEIVDKRRIVKFLQWDLSKYKSVASRLYLCYIYHRYFSDKSERINFLLDKFNVCIDDLDIMSGIILAHLIRYYKNNSRFAYKIMSTLITERNMNIYKIDFNFLSNLYIGLLYENNYDAFVKYIRYYKERNNQLNNSDSFFDILQENGAGQHRLPESFWRFCRIV